jgi:hypothetical protein
MHTAAGCGTGVRESEVRSAGDNADQEEEREWLP